jgi:hypothetical protein
VEIPHLRTWVFEIKEVGGKVWVRTGDGAYRIDGDKAVRMLDLKTWVFDIKEIARKVWVRTIEGAYRVDEDVFIKILALDAETWWKSLLAYLLPGNVWISGVVTPKLAYA